MSETFDPVNLLSSLSTARPREDRSSVLPFVPAETQDDSWSVSSFNRASGNSQATTPLPLIQKLCEALNAQQISYCHWKSNWKIKRWLAGEGDLDLLVDRADSLRFLSVLHGLGFKQAEPSLDRQVPGILNFYGLDGETGRFVHLHVHYQLVIGHDLSKNYHLPVEGLCLENSARYGLLPTPSREFELIVFVFRMILKFSFPETVARQVLAGRRAGKSALTQELAYLESKIDRARVANLLGLVVPDINYGLFEKYLQSLRPGTSLFTRMILRRQLQRQLKTSARRPQLSDALLKAWRRVTRTTKERLLNQRARKRFTNGGLLIAVIGGDGAGKTTALDALTKWSSKKFVTKRFHVGKPSRSLFTLSLIVMLRLRRILTNAPAHPERFLGHNQNAVFPGYLQLLRWVSAGRDRWRLYIKARRFATNGGIALCDRYPVPQIRLMESPNIRRTVAQRHRNALVKRLLKMEEGYYRKIMQPDLLIVLRLNPDIAVMRKTTETELHVRTRSGELWSQDWEETNACVIDAEQSAADVVAEAKSIIWARL